MGWWQLDCVQTLPKLGAVFENLAQVRLTQVSQGTVRKTEGRSNLGLPILDRLALTFFPWSSLSYILSSLKLWHQGYDKHVKLASDLLMSAVTRASQNSTVWLPWSPFFLSIYCSQSLELSRSVIFLQWNKISALIFSSTLKLMDTCRINILLKPTFPEIQEYKLFNSWNPNAGSFLTFYLNIYWSDGHS